MERIIDIENLRSFAYCNHAICKKPIKGIVVFFYGLGFNSMLNEDPQEGIDYAEQGILYLVPYQNPWSWMNHQNIALTDELIDVLMRDLDLPDDLPIVSSGRSMGGQSALVYTAYAKHTPIACVANCPVCDLPYHFTERPDLPRTLYSAFGSYDCGLEEALQSASPVHLTERMPVSTAYHIFHCEEDQSVSKKLHSDVFVEKMRPEHSVFYYSVPGKGHCDLSNEACILWRNCTIRGIDPSFVD